MKIYFKILLNFFFIGFYGIINGQNTRLNTYQTIGWYNQFYTVKFHKFMSIHAEYQWRRDKIISCWQQSLLRLGVNYSITPNVLLRVGYASIETYPYGLIPINSLGKNFSEHRIYEVLQLSHNEGIVRFFHRFMMEQRFVGIYSNPNILKEDGFQFLNRMRYMFRVEVPTNFFIKNNPLYVGFYDEVFIGFGKNVHSNVFDQNRLSFLLGIKHKNLYKFEIGYINQILQFGREINGYNIFQNNSGLILNSIFYFDLIKSK